MRYYKEGMNLESRKSLVNAIIDSDIVAIRDSQTNTLIGWINQKYDMISYLLNKEKCKCE